MQQCKVVGANCVIKWQLLWTALIFSRTLKWQDSLSVIGQFCEFCLDLRLLDSCVAARYILNDKGEEDVPPM